MNRVRTDQGSRRLAGKGIFGAVPTDIRLAQLLIGKPERAVNAGHSCQAFLLIFVNTCFKTIYTDNLLNAASALPELTMTMTELFQK